MAVQRRRRAPTDAQFRALLESAPDAMVIVNAGGSIILVNAQTERLFGYPREELLGQSVELLVPDRYRGAHSGHRLTYFSGAHPRPMGQGLDLFGRRKDGSEFPVEISLSPLQTPGGLVVASAIRDITERRAAEAERDRLRREQEAHLETNRVKDEFLATLSHELRTPLNAILGWISLVNTGMLRPEEIGRALKTIERNARVQAQLVEDLLDVSRIISGKLQLRSAALDLADVAEAAIEVVRPAAEAKGIRLGLHLDSRPVLMMGDAARLQQVIWNLLSNAVKFTPPNGSVDLSIGTSGSSVEISVTDTGEGISSTFLPHVFDRFRQADSTTTRNQGGLGLGLSIARSIVELHGGAVDVSSPGPGRGSTFRVSLPVARVADRRRTPRLPPDLSTLGNARVLVVDDEDDERTLLMRVFENAQCQVRGASTVSSALDVLSEWPAQLLVTDLSMAPDTGYDLVRQLRSTPPLRSIPAIAVTGHAGDEDRGAALSAGFDGYLRKPLNTDALLARASELLARASRH